KWNCGQFVDQKAFDLIHNTLTSTDTSAGKEYSAYLAEQLPVLWLPMPAYQISVVADGLDVGTQDPGTSFMPQRWSWS
ncbi:MAG: peptide ABC transporter substrate-binding protein, partial [Propionibacteriaceae bacterium]|nr:peptide ABC transporter substrate-binding protein [Propionibacteriaceae bacterium]